MAFLRLPTSSSCSLPFAKHLSSVAADPSRHRHSSHSRPLRVQSSPIYVQSSSTSCSREHLLWGLHYPRFENGRDRVTCRSRSRRGCQPGVNKPELLCKEFTPVIDVAGFLSDGQERRIAQEIATLETDTGFKLRVLAQNYPDTPGLAIKDFWTVDDQTIVFVADPTFGNILNFNVVATVDLDIPRGFWSHLAGKYCNIFYWKEKEKMPRLSRL